jgi:hypothetical protein
MTWSRAIPAGIAIGISEGVELFQIDVGDGRLFLQLAPRCGFEGLAVADEPSRQSPVAFERRDAALNEP